VRESALSELEFFDSTGKENSGNAVKWGKAMPRVAIPE
jgi:hypothetical protein